MSLQTHTFFLDTTHATPTGRGGWRFQLQEPIEVRDNQVVHVDDVTFRNSFPTVDVFSNKLYLFTQYLDRNAEAPNLAGTYTEHEGGSSISITVAGQAEPNTFRYTDGAARHLWTITSFDNPSQTFTLATEVKFTNVQIAATYDPATGRITPAQQTPPYLGGTWSRSEQPSGIVDLSVTWAPDGANFSYTDGGATVNVSLSGFDLATPTMTVNIGGQTFTWNENGFLERQNVRWTRTDSVQFFPRKVDYWEKSVPQTFSSGIVKRHAEIIEIPVDTMTSVGAVTSVVRGRMNAGFRWNGSATQFTTGFTDNILSISHNNAGNTEETFSIASDEELANPQFKHVWTSMFGGPDYDTADPLSINTLLGNTRKRSNTTMFDNNTPMVLGHVSPNHENVIYLHCPQLTGMRNRGPVMTSGSCIAPLPIIGAYGDILSYSPYREHRRLMPPPGQINHLDVSLRDSENHEIDMRGSKLSFSVSVV